MKFLTESRCSAETSGAQKSKRLNYFYKVMSKTDTIVDITGSNHVSATHLHIKSAVNTLDIKTIKKGNQMELPK